MKRNLFLTILVLIAFSGIISAQKHYLFAYFINRGQDGLHLAHSTDGLNWTELNNGQAYVAPQVGPDKLMRDPFIIKGHDGYFHMVWTTGWTDKCIGYARSKDLISWEEQKTIPVMEYEPTTLNSWAPEIFYDKKNKNYLIIWASTIPDRHSPIQMSEKENKYNHRMYYVTTKDFKTFSETSIFYNPDFSVIDATILARNNQFYMVLKNENPNPPEKNLRVAVSKNAAGPYSTNVSDPITGKYWAEGPTTLQIGEYVYVYFDKYREHHYGVIRSKDMKTWEDVSDKAVFPKGIRHGNTFEVKKSVVNKLMKHQSQSSTATN